MSVCVWNLHWMHWNIRWINNWTKYATKVTNPLHSLHSSHLERVSSFFHSSASLWNRDKLRIDSQQTDKMPSTHKTQAKLLNGSYELPSCSPNVSHIFFLLVCWLRRFWPHCLSIVCAWFLLIYSRIFLVCAIVCAVFFFALSSFSSFSTCFFLSSSSFSSSNE